MFAPSTARASVWRAYRHNSGPAGASQRRSTAGDAPRVPDPEWFA